MDLFKRYYPNQTLPEGILRAVTLLEDPSPDEPSEEHGLTEEAIEELIDEKVIEAGGETAPNFAAMFDIELQV